MARKFWNVNNVMKILKAIGYTTIGGLGVFIFTQRLSAKDDSMAAKDAQIVQLKEQIEHLQVFQFPNVNAEFEALKNLYKNQKEMYELKIQALESANGNAKQIEVYRKKILVLETKLNLIAQVADDYTKGLIKRMGKELQFDEVKPFAYFALYDHRDSSKVSFRALYDWYYNYVIQDKNVVTIPPPKPGDYPCPFIMTGTHSPLYYSFDNVDLRTATFKKTDLRGVDLSDALMDANTKIPGIK